MTTAISTAYDEIVTVLNSLYGSTHKQLENPYILEDNDELTLRRGYGFVLQNATNTNRLLSNVASIQREVNIILTIKWRGTQKDVSLRQTAEKQLLEDHFLLIEYFTANAGMNISQVWKMVYNGDSGLEFIFTDKQNYIGIQSNFSLEYSEDC